MGKELLKLLSAGIGTHASRDGESMVEAVVAVERVERAQRSALGICRTIHAAIDAGVYHKARAHAARLERHIYGAAGETPAAEHTGCLDHGGKLGMR